MKLHDLKPTKGSKHSKVRRGRGDASGNGSFSGRGCKGQKARTGGGVRPGFEGGQTPLIQRMPKRRGFTNPGRKEFAPVNLDTLEKNFADGALISPETLKAQKIVRSNAGAIKILSRGKLSKKLVFRSVAFSASAKTKVTKAGSTVES